MKSLINIAFLLLAGFSIQAQCADKMSQLEIISIYQIEDEEEASFDFFTSKKVHKCGGKLSNRFRSYSTEESVARRKFELILSAMNQGYKVTLSGNECEGRSLLVEFIGISR
jgi:hypothetical protein